MDNEEVLLAHAELELTKCFDERHSLNVSDCSTQLNDTNLHSWVESDPDVNAEDADAVVDRWGLLPLAPNCQQLQAAWLHLRPIPEQRP